MAREYYEGHFCGDHDHQCEPVLMEWRTLDGEEAKEIIYFTYFLLYVVDGEERLQGHFCGEHDHQCEPVLMEWKEHWMEKKQKKYHLFVTFTYFLLYVVDGEGILRGPFLWRAWPSMWACLDGMERTLEGEEAKEIYIIYLLRSHISYCM